MAQKKNNKRVKLHVKTGDRVLVLSGESKGVVGTITKIFSETQRAIVEGEGIKKVKRHVRPTAESPGGIYEREFPIHVSNLMLVGADDVASRYKMEIRDDKKVRVLKKTQEVIE